MSPLCKKPFFKNVIVKRCSKIVKFHFQEWRVLEFRSETLIVSIFEISKIQNPDSVGVRIRNK